MPLKISLKPGEKFVLNGAVIENGDRRANLVLQNKASVLREKDILQAADVDTPVKRIYFPIMMMYLSDKNDDKLYCLLYTSPSPRDLSTSRMPSSA